MGDNPNMFRLTMTLDNPTEESIKLARARAESEDEYCGHCYKLIDDHDREKGRIEVHVLTAWDDSEGSEVFCSWGCAAESAVKVALESPTEEDEPAAMRWEIVE